MSTNVTTPALTAAERRRLTLWKWRYSLEEQGFTTEQAERLIFVKWLAARQPSLREG